MVLSWTPNISLIPSVSHVLLERCIPIPFLPLITEPCNHWNWYIQIFMGLLQYLLTKVLNTGCFLRMIIPDSDVLFHLGRNQRHFLPSQDLRLLQRICLVLNSR